MGDRLFSPDRQIEWEQGGGQGLFMGLDRITLDHGSGGEASQELIEDIYRRGWYKGSTEMNTEKIQW